MDWKENWMKTLRGRKEKKDPAMEKSAQAELLRRAEPFELNFQFADRREENLRKINEELGKYALSRVDISNFRGYLAVETRTDAATGQKQLRHWYGLDACTLRCTPAAEDESFRFQLSTMTMDKSQEDGARFWSNANPGQQLRHMLKIEFDSVYALIVAYHEKKPVQSKEDPRKKALWHLEDYTLYIHTQGELTEEQLSGKKWNAMLVKKVVIEPGCTGIGKELFKNHQALTSVQLPVGLETIGMWSFYGCTGLKEIVIPETVTGIHAAAFSGCTGLESIVLPKGLAEISNSLFWRCTGLKSAVLPDSITKIGNAAFYGCKALEAVRLPESLLLIDNAAFRECLALQTIQIPRRVQEIRDYAFADCVCLDRVIFSNGKPRIAGTAFEKAPAFAPRAETAKTVPAANIHSDDHRSWWHMEGDTLHIRVSGVLRQTQTGETRWDPRAVRAVVIAPGCTVIDTKVFKDHKNLESVEIPAGVKTIGFHAFEGCTQLKTVELPAGVTSIYEDAFRGCAALSELILPAGLSRIGNSAFRGCSGLRTVTLYPGLQTMGHYAFRDCTALVSVNLPVGVITIGEEAFRNCTQLGHIILPDTATGMEKAAFRGCTALRMMDLPKGIRKISESLFQDCTELRFVTIPQGVTVVEDGAFLNCSCLRKAMLPQGIQKIGTSAFLGCTQMVQVNLPESLRTIGKYAFKNCVQLSRVEIGNDVREIGTDAFRNVPLIHYTGWKHSEDNWGALTRTGKPKARGYCGESLAWRVEGDILFISGTGRLRCSEENWRAFRSQIRHVVIGSGCTAIAKYVFQNHDNLQTVHLPGTLRFIGAAAFRNCPKLTFAVIPASVVGIGAEAFRNCRELELVLPGTHINKGEDAFADTRQVFR